MKILLEKSLSQALTRAVGCDDDHHLLMQGLKGRSLSLCVQDLQFFLTLMPGEAGFTCQLGQSKLAETLITGKLKDLAQLLTAKNPQSAFTGSQVKVEGQVATLQAYQTFFKQIHFDFEGQLAKRVGAVPARVVTQPLRWLRQTGVLQVKALSADLTEWLQEESLLLAPPLAIENHYTEVLSLQERIDRLEARIHRLK